MPGFGSFGVDRSPTESVWSIPVMGRNFFLGWVLVGEERIKSFLSFAKFYKSLESWCIFWDPVKFKSSQ